MLHAATAALIICCVIPEWCGPPKPHPSQCRKPDVDRREDSTYPVRFDLGVSRPSGLHIKLLGAQPAIPVRQSLTTGIFGRDYIRKCAWYLLAPFYGFPEVAPRCLVAEALHLTWHHMEAISHVLCSTRDIQGQSKH
ncbi:hypothetical protein F5Y16DRAFT_129956 [Xylariaceae sp. FL0255]|nr:hypothetical protein F5Y16DRAFT_129956 [Xylariaceae sp. FL0255]